jgi:predicted phage replisome organizer
MTTAPSWIKLSTGWYRDEKIKLILEMPEGGSIVAVFLMMLALAGEKNLGGELILDDATPYDAEMLACIFDRKVNTVRLALKVLEQFRMIQISEDRRIVITNWWKWQNVEGLDKIRQQTAERNRKFRALKREQNFQKRLLDLGQSANQRDQANAVQQKCDVTRDATMRHGASPEIERETEVEVEREKDKESEWLFEGERWSTHNPLKTSSKQAREKLDHLVTQEQQQAIARLLGHRYSRDYICFLLKTDQETIRLVDEVYYPGRLETERLRRQKAWLGALFGRPDEQAWSEREEALLKKLLPISLEDGKVIRWGYSLQKNPDGWSIWEHQRLNTKPKQSLLALLENFASECDKWRGARRQLGLRKTIKESEIGKRPA